VQPKRAKAQPPKSKQLPAAPSLPAHAIEASLAPAAPRAATLDSDCMEDDDYDPRKSEYVKAATHEEVAARASSLLSRQIARLESSLTRRRCSATTPQALLDHYEVVLDDMRRTASAPGCVPLASSSAFPLDELPIPPPSLPQRCGRARSGSLELSLGSDSDSTAPCSGSGTSFDE